jgi:hypothetical protein
MSDFEAEHSVEADVNPTFAWDWRTDVETWDEPPAKFCLEGPFAAGSWGMTVFPGQEPLRWHIRAVTPYRSFIIEIPLDRATLSFEWRFDALSDRRTRLTQHILLSGANAAAYAGQVQAAFGRTLRDGMDRIARAMVTAEDLARRAG